MQVAGKWPPLPPTPCHKWIVWQCNSLLHNPFKEVAGVCAFPDCWKLLHGKWCGIPNNRPYLMFITWKFYKQMVRILFLGFPHQHHWLQPSTNGWCSRHLVESHWWPGWSSIDRLWWRTTPDGVLGNGWASSSYFHQADPCLKNLEARRWQERTCWRAQCDTFSCESMHIPMTFPQKTKSAGPMAW